MNDFAKKMLINMAISVGTTTAIIAVDTVKKKVIAPARLHMEVKRASKELVKETEEFLQTV